MKEWPGEMTLYELTFDDKERKDRAMLQVAIPNWLIEDNIELAMETLSYNIKREMLNFYKGERE